MIDKLERLIREANVQDLADLDLVADVELAYRLAKPGRGHDRPIHVPGRVRASG